MRRSWRYAVDCGYNAQVQHKGCFQVGGPGAIEWTSSEEDSVNRQQANDAYKMYLFIAAGSSAVGAQIGTPGSAEDTQSLSERWIPPPPPCKVLKSRTNRRVESAKYGSHG